VIAKWMLDECGVAYEIVPIDVKKREHKTPEFLQINPAGKLPALVDGDSRIFENTAICLYLGDKFPEAKLAPKIGAPERGRYLSLMVYSTSQLEPAMGDALLDVSTLPRLDRLRDRQGRDRKGVGRRPLFVRRLVQRR